MIEPQDKQNTDKQPPLLNVWSLAGELGLLIALPLVLFILIGVKIDKSFHTTPLFIIIGMVLSFVISATAIVRKVKNLDKMNQ